MSASDIVSLGILILCILLGIYGFFKCLSHFLSGLIVGLLILICISVWVENPGFDRISHGIFQNGRILPYLRDFTISSKEKIWDQLSKQDREEKESDSTMNISTASLFPSTDKKQ